MAKAIVENLIGDLHQRYGDALSSSQQQQLMQNLQNHIHGLDEAAPIDPNFKETLDLLLDEVESEHPQAATIVRQIMDTLNNMGI